MVPFLAPLVAKVAESAFMKSPIGGFLKRFWKPILLALVVGFIIWRGLAWHAAKVEAFGTERYNAGFEAAKAATKKAAARVEVKGRDMAAEVRSKNDAKVADIERDAGAVLVRGAGRAACSPVTPAATDGQAPGGSSDGAVSPLPSGEGEPLIGLPVSEAVGFAQQNDTCLADNASWWEWYERYSAIIADYKRQIEALEAKGAK